MASMARFLSSLPIPVGNRRIPWIPFLSKRRTLGLPQNSRAAMKNVHPNSPQSEGVFDKLFTHFPTYPYFSSIEVAYWEPQKLNCAPFPALGMGRGGQL